MAKKSRRQKKIEALLDQWGPEIESAFLASIDEIKSDADFALVVKRLAASDISGALDALHIDAGAFSRFTDQIARAFASGAAVGTQSMPKETPNGQKLVIRFDGQQTDAERILKELSSTAVVEVTEDQRNMARDALTRGLTRGDNPRTVALDMVGRYDKKLGKRTGGFIGLTTRQEQTIQNAADELREGSSKSLNAYLDRKLRNKSFDRYVLKAIKTGDPIPRDIQQKAISRMKDNALKLRGDTIGRTEALSALHTGQYQAYNQAIQRGELSVEDIERTWHTAGDSRVRDDHRLMNGQTIGFTAYYRTPGGGRLQYPGDPRGEAREIINCRCHETIRVNFLKRLR